MLGVQGQGPHLTDPLVPLPGHRGVVEDDEAGADHADGVEDVGWLAVLGQYHQLLLVQPGVSRLQLLLGLSAQLGVDEGEVVEGERGKEVDQMFTQLGGQLGEAGLTSLGVHCPSYPVQGRVIVICSIVVSTLHTQTTSWRSCFLIWVTSPHQDREAEGNASKRPVDTFLICAR